MVSEALNTRAGNTATKRPQGIWAGGQQDSIHYVPRFMIFLLLSHSLEFELLQFSHTHYFKSRSSVDHALCDVMSRSCVLSRWLGYLNIVDTFACLERLM
jgi:hypothetical protein